MKFKPGFRFSGLDASILILAACLAFFLRAYSALYSLLVGFIILHFFLFCNMVRMSRIPELIWSSFFLGIFYLHFSLSILSFNLALISSLFVSTVLILLECHQPSYHGIFWEKINPNLPRWFSENQKHKLS